VFSRPFLQCGPQSPTVDSSSNYTAAVAWTTKTETPRPSAAVRTRAHRRRLSTELSELAAATSAVPASTAEREGLILDKSATATKSLACRDYQVSGPTFKKLRTLCGAQHTVPERLEVVRLQQSMLHEVIGDNGIDIDRWCLVHVLHEYINPVSKEQTFTVRYEDGEVEDVCAGFVHRPEKALREHTCRRPSTAAAASKAPAPACHTTSDGTHTATGTFDPNPMRETPLQRTSGANTPRHRPWTAMHSQ
jgi:hypothetical protein